VPTPAEQMLDQLDAVKAQYMHLLETNRLLKTPLAKLSAPDQVARKKLLLGLQPVVAELVRKTKAAKDLRAQEIAAAAAPVPPPPVPIVAPPRKTIDAAIDQYVNELATYAAAYNASYFPGQSTTYARKDGRKYAKIVATANKSRDPIATEEVFCFVNRDDGGIYKAASWSAAAKGVRGNVLDPADRACLMTYSSLYVDEPCAPAASGFPAPKVLPTVLEFRDALVAALTGAVPSIQKDGAFSWHGYDGLIVDGGAGRYDVQWPVGTSHGDAPADANMAGVSARIGKAYAAMYMPPKRYGPLDEEFDMAVLTGMAVGDTIEVIWTQHWRHGHMTDVASADVTVTRLAEGFKVEGEKHPGYVAVVPPKVTYGPYLYEDMADAFDALTEFSKTGKLRPPPPVVPMPEIPTVDLGSAVQEVANEAGEVARIVNIPSGVELLDKLAENLMEAGYEHTVAVLTRLKQSPESLSGNSILRRGATIEDVKAVQATVDTALIQDGADAATVNATLDVIAFISLDYTLGRTRLMLQRAADAVAQPACAGPAKDQAITALSGAITAYKNAASLWNDNDNEEGARRLIRLSAERATRAAYKIARSCGAKPPSVSMPPDYTEDGAETPLTDQPSPTTQALPTAGDDGPVEVEETVPPEDVAVALIDHDGNIDQAQAFILEVYDRALTPDELRRGVAYYIKGVASDDRTFDALWTVAPPRFDLGLDYWVIELSTRMAKADATDTTASTMWRNVAMPKNVRKEQTVAWQVAGYTVLTDDDFRGLLVNGVGEQPDAASENATDLHVGFIDGSMFIDEVAAAAVVGEPSFSVEGDATGLTITAPGNVLIQLFPVSADDDMVLPSNENVYKVAFDEATQADSRFSLVFLLDSNGMLSDALIKQMGYWDDLRTSGTEITDDQTATATGAPEAPETSLERIEQGTRSHRAEWVDQLATTGLDFAPSTLVLDGSVITTLSNETAQIDVQIRAWPNENQVGYRTDLIDLQAEETIGVSGDTIALDEYLDGGTMLADAVSWIAAKLAIEPDKGRELGSSEEVRVQTAQKSALDTARAILAQMNATGELLAHDVPEGV
jgi:hypothetical protein